MFWVCRLLFFIYQEAVLLQAPSMAELTTISWSYPPILPSCEQNSLQLLSPISFSLDRPFVVSIHFPFPSYKTPLAPILVIYSLSIASISLIISLLTLLSCQPSLSPHLNPSSSVSTVKFPPPLPILFFLRIFFPFPHFPPTPFSRQGSVALSCGREDDSWLTGKGEGDILIKRQQ